MAKKGNDIIKLTKEDFEGGFKVAPGGAYRVKVDTTQTKLNGKGNLSINAKITGDKKGKKSEHKGVSFFDTIAPTVTWKVAQIVSALGMKKTSITLEEIRKALIKSGGADLVAILRQKMYEGKKRNEVVQWLPIGGAAAEDIDEDEDLDDEEEDEEEIDDEDVEEEEEEEEEEEDEPEDEDEEEEEEEDDDDLDEEEDEDIDEEDDEEEEEEEEEPEPPKARKRASPSTAAAKTTAKRGRKR